MAAYGYDQWKTTEPDDRHEPMAGLVLCQGCGVADVPPDGTICGDCEDRVGEAMMATPCVLCGMPVGDPEPPHQWDGPVCGPCWDYGR
jgi:hypothetical protein